MSAPLCSQCGEQPAVVRVMITDLDGVLQDQHELCADCRKSVDEVLS